MGQLKISDLVARAGPLASFPAIFDRVNELIDKPGSSASDLAHVISTDQGLSARLLRIVNSSFYGFPARVDTISQAVVIIGTRQLRDLVMGTIAVAQFAGLKTDLVDMAAFWKHSVASALICRALASRRNEANRERLFISGLLHDVGSLLLYQQAPKQSAEAIELHRAESVSLHDAETRILGFDHGAVGTALMTAWKLPPVIRAAAGEHHRFALSSSYPTESATVHVADVIAHAMSMGSNGEQLVPPLDPSAWEVLGLESRVIPLIVDEAERLLEEVGGLFLNRGAA